MAFLVRFVLNHLVVALVAIGLASAPWHAVARTADPGPGMSVHKMQATHAAYDHADHRHGSPAKSHAVGLACCHPGCIMAVVPALASTSQGLPLSELVPIPPDMTPMPALRSGIDRPPKRA